MARARSKTNKVSGPQFDFDQFVAWTAAEPDLRALSSSVRIQLRLLRFAHHYTAKPITEGRPIRREWSQQEIVTRLRMGYSNSKDNSEFTTNAPRNDLKAWFRNRVAVPIPGTDSKWRFWNHSLQHRLTAQYLAWENQQGKSLPDGVWLEYCSCKEWLEILDWYVDEIESPLSFLERIFVPALNVSDQVKRRQIEKGHNYLNVSQQLGEEAKLTLRLSLDDSSYNTSSNIIQSSVNWEDAHTQLLYKLMTEPLKSPPFNLEEMEVLVFKLGIGWAQFAKANARLENQVMELIKFMINRGTIMELLTVIKNERSELLAKKEYESLRALL